MKLGDKSAPMDTTKIGDLSIPIDYTIDDLLTEPSDAYEALMWRQTGGWFSWKYYDRLKHSMPEPAR
jgi:hypothetical protein